jgi:hypothetical protein
VPTTQERAYALLAALEQLPPPTRELDAHRAKLLGVPRDADSAFAGAVEALFAVLESGPLTKNKDAVSAVIEVIAYVTRDPQNGGGMTAALGLTSPPAPKQEPAPGSIQPVSPPPVRVVRGSTKMPRVLSYGGGLDSFAILVRSIEINDKPDVAIFMDVAGGTAKKDSPAPGEWPGTYKHIREIVIPMCKKAGIEFVWLGPEIPVRAGTAGEARSLFEWMEARGQIPVSSEKRICTTVAKVERFEKWMKQRYGDQRIEVWIGFEAGEQDRIANDPNAHVTTQRSNRYPLAEWDWCRCRAEQYIRSKRLPVPRKSACVFCPFGQMTEWQTFARELPKVFARVVKMEQSKFNRPTKAGMRLSIKGYGWIGKYKNKEERAKIKGVPKLGVHYKAPLLPVWIKGVARPKVEQCNTCKAIPKATKEVGCHWLP